MMKPVLTTLRWVPPFAVGYVRDLRVRWALEELGRAYDVRLIGQDDQRSPDYRQEQPFGQVPVLRDGDLVLFESGAIVHHLALQSELLMPADAAARARTTGWLVAALNSVEPQVGAWAELALAAPGQAWVEQARPLLEQRARQRLADLNAWLEDRPYLTGNFSAADIVMACVVKLVANTPLLGEQPALHAYFERCTARPAYARALAAQMAVYAPA